MGIILIGKINFSQKAFLMSNHKKKETSQMAVFKSLLLTLIFGSLLVSIAFEQLCLAQIWWHVLLLATILELFLTD